MEFLIILGTIGCVAGVLALAIVLSIRRSHSRIVPGSEWVRDEADNNPFMIIPYVTVSEVSKNHLTYHDDENIYTTDKFKFLERYKIRPSKKVKEGK